MTLKIKFTPDSRSDIGSGYEKAWKAGRVDLAALSATDLRYGFFEYPVDLIVDGHAFLSAARPPLIDIMFTLGRSLQSLRSAGAAKVDFTDNTYVIRMQLVGRQIEFTSTPRGVPTPHPSCSFDEYVSEVRSSPTAWSTSNLTILHWPGTRRCVHCGNWRTSDRKEAHADVLRHPIPMS
ncbi:hypothetical protein [Streptomyces albus]|uniref:hypothetical protein n=1 Tax=Streptomyces albus TaxID=1888 RepID=UPI001FCA3EBB|nr:hypothetical protein [Streptomyces albus]